MPLISVIVPVYKVEPYLRRCVDSILAQTFTDFELILVDDGSPDNCGAICDEYAEKDGRVHVIHQQNGGLSAARNAGIDWAFANSDSKWLNFVDSDDWVHYDYLKLLLECALNYGVRICQCNSIDVRQYVNPESIRTSFRLCAPEEAYSMHGMATAVQKLYAKELFLKIRFPIGKLHEDEFVTYRLYFAVDEIAHVNARLYYYFLRDDSIMHGKWTFARCDALDAFSAQVAFFLERNNTKMANVSAASFINCAEWNLNECKKSDYCRTKRQRYTRMIRRKMQRFICANKQNLDLTIERVPSAFEVGFPTEAWFYWTIHGLLRKVRN